MKSKINRELIPVLEDVFVTEGIVDTFKGLAEKRSLRLAERYIKGSILTVNKNIEKNAYVSGIDKSNKIIHAGQLVIFQFHWDIDSICTKHIHAGTKGNLIA